MGNMVSKVFLAAAVTVLGAFAADNSLGTWKVNMDKSQFSPSAPFKSLTTTREAVDGGAKVSSTGEAADGKPINSSRTEKYDGTEFAVVGSPWDTMSVKQVNANTLTSNAKKTDGKFRMRGRSVISSDGKTMTTTSRGTTAEGKPFSYTMIYDKQ